MRRILAIDGGGIRGIIPCCVLAELERRTGKLTRDLFEMVAGTSTGALLAAAIAAGIPAERILRIYTERSKEIFNGTLTIAKLVAEGYRYHPENIERVLRSEFQTAKEWRLNDCPIKVLITAIGVDKKPKYFVKDNDRNKALTGKLSLIDCAVASAAAPTYFLPWYVPPATEDLVGWCFDGGIGTTGNPVYQAAVEAFLYDDFTPADTRITSLGTGFFPSTQVNRPKGLLATLSWIVDTLMSSAHDLQTDLMRRHYPGVMDRNDWQLPGPIDMGDTSSIPQLLTVGRAAGAAADLLKT